MTQELKFVFVGERPSPRAKKLGITWQSAGLSGKTLAQALLEAGVEPKAQYYLNLYQSPFKEVDQDLRDELVTIATIRQLVEPEGLVVIGMGRIVQCRLEHYGVIHHRLIHPAARGLIRRRDCYQLHVKSVLEAIRQYHFIHGLVAAS